MNVFILVRFEVVRTVLYESGPWNVTIVFTMLSGDNTLPVPVQHLSLKSDSIHCVWYGNKSLNLC